jgi:outer membrane lipoprotein carrier protein
MKLPMWFLGVAACMVSGVVQASAVDKLKSFVQGTQTARAKFTQTVADRSGHVVQEASGTMQFSRPGRFRWVYDKPYEQLIVGDGEKLWVYDVELNQVTVKKLDEALGASPAALLAGNNEIEKNFKLTEAGSKDGLEWLDATPKGKDNSFEAVHMGFGPHGLQVMELHDNFGQTTVINFSGLERNPKLNADQFKFAPPKGADVIGE